MGLFKLRDDGPMLPEYKWDDNQHELLQYPENKKRGGDCLLSEAQAFFVIHPWMISSGPTLIYLAERTGRHKKRRRVEKVGPEKNGDCQEPSTNF